MEQIRSRDGAAIALHSTGTGPGIVVVHGGGVTIDLYRRLANALADRFTVHLYNRRGRADAPARREPYTFEQEIEDIAAILEHTGARNVIGHSAGGFIALQAALQLPIDRLALYDPAVCINGNPPGPWLESARAAAAAGDIARGLAITAAGINPQMPASKLPLGIRIVMLRAFMRTPIGRTMGDLLSMTLEETAIIWAHDGPAEQWSGVTADVLLACGADGPPYYVDNNEALARVMPRARTLQIPRSGHDALNRARPRLVTPIADFFAAPVTPRSDHRQSGR